MTKRNFIILIMLGYCITANAQVELTKTVVAGSGGNFASGTLTLSSTVAEMTMVTTMSASGSDLFQGFQNNAWMIQDVHVNPVRNIEISVALFPNPASVFLTLEMADRSPGKLTIGLNDLLGRTVRFISVAELQNKIQFDVKELPSGVYALSMFDQSQQKVFNQTVTIIH